MLRATGHVKRPFREKNGMLGMRGPGCFRWWGRFGVGAPVQCGPALDKGAPRP